MNNEAAKTVIQHYYPHHFQQTSPEAQSLGMAGGFSGARFWKFHRAHDVDLCLRRWPGSKSASMDYLRWVHRQLQQVAESGFTRFPNPVASRNGTTLVSHAGSLWQLEPWLPGRPTFHEEPSPKKLREAMSTLAQFHNALKPTRQLNQTSTGIESRLTRIQRWYSPMAGQFTPRLDELEMRLREADHAPVPEIREAGLLICNGFRRMASSLLEELNQAKNQPVETQSVIADIWHDHVLFEGDKVSGIIDFGAMREDVVACDIARLLGSLIADDAMQRRNGLDAYRAAFHGTAPEESLIDLFDRSTVMLAGMNWLDWILIEGRQFDDWHAVTCRIQRIQHRLKFMVRTL